MAICALCLSLCSAQEGHIEKVGDRASIPAIDFVSIPAGSFVMGADIAPKHIAAWEDDGWRSIFIQDEFPVRNIHISRSFDLSTFEITNEVFEAFDPDHKLWRGHFQGISNADNEAVVYVSWEEAVAFTAWLSEQDAAHDYRLPTEAEWEYATRANTRTPFNDGRKGIIYELNPFNVSEMTDRKYQWPYPFTYSNGCRSWVSWRPDNCTGVNDVYPENDGIQDADLRVGRHGPNSFGVYDMHGGVEEWVLDWYAPYNPEDSTDPLGYASGDFKVARGGSHNNHVQHARSANRMGAAVNDKHYFLGFRIVRIPENQEVSPPTGIPPKRPWAEPDNDQAWDWCEEEKKPVFSMSSLYELVPAREDGSHYGTDEHLRQFGFDPEKEQPLLTGPLYSHNHSPTISWAENGDLLVSWFSGESETGPELTLLACRGKRQSDGSLHWTSPAEFLKAPDRNMHGSHLLNNHFRMSYGADSIFTLHQVASIGVSGRWDKLALGYRGSQDHGKTWSPVHMILELDHGLNHGAQMQGNALETSDGKLIFVTDDASDGQSNTSSLVLTADNGKTWERRGHSSDTPGEQRIAGIHAAVAEIEDVNGDQVPDLMAISRDKGVYFDGQAPKSISVDGGRTWTRSASVFPSIGTGRRMTLTRLRHSPSHPLYPGQKALMFTGFADEGIRARDGQGSLTTVTGLYAALSFDEGETWPEEYRRVISNLEVDEEFTFEGAPWQRTHTLSRTKGQEHGYIAATQTPDGMIYLSDGKMVYSFNLDWLMDGLESEIGEGSLEEAFQIKPNPNRGRFTLDFGPEMIEVGKVDIYSMEGKCIYSKAIPRWSRSSCQVVVPGVQPGLYLLKISTEERSYNKKILVV